MLTPWMLFTFIWMGLTLTLVTANVIITVNRFFTFEIRQKLLMIQIAMCLVCAGVALLRATGHIN